jgi:hypothetical protein
LTATASEARWPDQSQVKADSVKKFEAQAPGAKKFAQAKIAVPTQRQQPELAGSIERGGAPERLHPARLTRARNAAKPSADQFSGFKASFAFWAAH